MTIVAYRYNKLHDSEEPRFTTLQALVDGQDSVEGEAHTDRPMLWFRQYEFADSSLEDNVEEEALVLWEGDIEGADSIAACFTVGVKSVCATHGLYRHGGIVYRAYEFKRDIA